MAANVEDILPKASDVMVQIAEAQAEKAAAHDRQKAATSAEKEALIKKLSQPSGIYGGRKSQAGRHGDQARDG